MGRLLCVWVWCLLCAVIQARPLELSADGPVLRDGPAHLRIRIANWATPARDTLVVRALPPTGAPIELLRAAIDIPAGATRILDTCDDPRLPGAADSILGCSYDGGWEVGDRLARSVYLSNTAHDDGPRGDIGALRLRYTGGLGGMAFRKLAASVPVQADADILYVRLYGQGPASTQRIKLALRGRARPNGPEETYYAFTLLSTEDGKNYVYAHVRDTVLEDAIPLNFTGWREFRLPVRGFMPFPRITAVAAMRPASDQLAEVTGFGVLLDGVGTYYLDDVILSRGTTADIIDKSLTWNIAKLPNGRYTLEAELGDQRAVLTVALAGLRKPPVVARVVPGPRGMVLSINGARVAPVVHTPIVPAHRTAIPNYAAGGINLHVIDWLEVYGNRNWIGPGDYNGFTQLDVLLRELLEANPNGYFLLKAGGPPPKWWMERYPNERIAYESGPPAGTPPMNWYQPSMASERWRHDEAAYLDALVSHIRQGPFADRIIGYWLVAGHSGEWWHPGLYYNAPHLVDYSPPMRAAFRRYLRARYHTQAALRAAWRQTTVTFETATIPTEALRLAPGRQFGGFRDPVADAPVIDYYRCHNAVVAESLSILAAAVKHAARGESLVGAMAAYNALSVDTEWGHANFPAVIRTPIDFLCSESGYAALYPGAGPMSRHTEASVGLHGKLFLMENDHTTNDAFVKAGVTRDNALAEELVKRDAIRPFIAGIGTEWYDMHPPFRRQGAYAAPNVLAKLVRVRNLAQQELDSGYLPPKTARVNGMAMIFDDGRSALYTDNHTRDLLLNSAPYQQIQFELPYVGCRLDCYNLDDIATMPDYPVVVFYLTLHMTERQMAIVRRRFLGSGHTVLWVYPPAMISDYTINLTRSAQLMGMPVRYAGVERPGAMVSTFDDPLTVAMQSAVPRPPFTGQIQPYRANALSRDTQGVYFGVASENRIGLPPTPLFAVDAAPGAITLARFVANQRAAIAVRRLPDWTSIYSGVPYLPAEFLREVARAGGVQVYGIEFEALWANERWLGVHTNQHAGLRTYTLPAAAHRITEVFTDTAIPVDGRQFHYEMQPLTTYLFKIE